MKTANADTATEESLSNLKPTEVGLPGLETIVFRYIGVPLGSVVLGRAAAEKMFLQEGERLLYATQDVDKWLLDQRVHVRRVPGMEEGSVQWSMEQLVEHTITTGQGIANTLRRLLEAPIAHGDANVVHCVPVGGGREEIRKNLQDFLTRFSDEFSGVTLPRTGHARHPWFGNLNAGQWFRLAAINNLVHRVHGERILDRLPHTDWTQ